MAHESVQPRQKSFPAAVDQRDPKKITDLIEQLESRPCRNREEHFQAAVIIVSPGSVYINS